METNVNIIGKYSGEEPHEIRVIFLPNLFVATLQSNFSCFL